MSDSNQKRKNSIEKQKSSLIREACGDRKKVKSNYVNSFCYVFAINGNDDRMCETKKNVRQKQEMKIQNVFLFLGTFLVIQSLIMEDQHGKEYNAVSSGQFTSKILFQNREKRNFVFINANNNTKGGDVNFIRLEFSPFLHVSF